MEELLPIGTVVLLKEKTIKLMITGVKQRNGDDPDRIYDYIGVIFPIGFLGDESQFLFNSDQINDVIYKGYQDEEYEEFCQFVNRFMEREGGE